MAPERDVGIDELLGVPADAEVEVRPAKAATLGPLRAAGIALIIAGAAYAVLLAAGFKIPYILLFAMSFALLILWRALRVVEAPRLSVGAPPRPAARIDPTQVADGMQLALGRWETRLSWSEQDPQRFIADVRPRLADIADERLRQRHGVTRADDPWRARELMGERLWTFLFAPLASAPNPRELAAVVDDMEKL
ncbi:hypothetical protein HC028_10200 [Planosporangium flavigriseum]|uniref:Uncharacterized protein n=1 Tax=Planosporangium flavigriseum TaxID=373681 RepID=A0A8J3LG59_9ACTN|nr:hypothetical protein [Planosporangium flavigriseum]NJC64871.1 hypothetical protein [Planosporangium flavigriseum]GIG72743.1 hypothetical protein Pfl04_11470 [Planosporangium flavigriseum]